MSTTLKSIDWEIILRQLIDLVLGIPINQSFSVDYMFFLLKGIDFPPTWTLSCRCIRFAWETLPPYILGVPPFLGAVPRMRRFGILGTSVRLVRYPIP